jgi:HAD superfamily hydrolase (TIGR01509 family)
MRAVLFDFDGVLVNSEPLHFHALRDALLPEGIAIGKEDYLRWYLAYDDREAIRVALERHGQAYDGSRVQALAERKAAHFEESLRRVPFFPGARELVRALEREVPLAIVSGALKGEIEAILASGGLADAFKTIVGAEDVRQGKPHPEPYLSGLARLRPLALGLEAEDCLVFEDSMAGIASARAAGMKVVGVAHSYPATKLSAAHLVIETLADAPLESLRALFDRC